MGRARIVWICCHIIPPKCTITLLESNFYENVDFPKWFSMAGNSGNGDETGKKNTEPSQILFFAHSLPPDWNRRKIPIPLTEGCMHVVGVD